MQVCTRCCFHATRAAALTITTSRLRSAQFMAMESNTMETMAARVQQENERASHAFEQTRKAAIAEHTETLRELVEGWVANGLMRPGLPAADEGGPTTDE